MGRPKSVTNINVTQEVVQSVTINPHCSIRQISNVQAISKSSVQRIMKTEKFHPYKVHLIQALTDDDFDKRTFFCEVMMDKCNRNPFFSRKILFSDEATFYLNGVVNRHNYRYWSNDNPHWTVDAHTQWPKKLNVWAGILGDHIIGPYFIPNLNSATYLELLRSKVVPAVKELYPDV